jgi:predicted Zn-ribbon and HTH transcriptional regulator
MERDEHPIHFECNECGYHGTEDQLIMDGRTFNCPICESPDIKWMD